MCPNGNERGAGLPFAIFVILVLAIVGLAISALDRSGQAGVALDVQSTRAFLAAQSGAEIGINRLLPPGTAPGSCASPFFSGSPSLSFSSLSLDQCSATVTCRVEIAGGGPYYLLTSTGRCGIGESLATRVVEVGVRP